MAISNQEIRWMIIYPDDEEESQRFRGRKRHPREIAEILARDMGGKCHVLPSYVVLTMATELPEPKQTFEEFLDREDGFLDDFCRDPKERNDKCRFFRGLGGIFNMLKRCPGMIFKKEMPD